MGPFNTKLLQRRRERAAKTWPKAAFLLDRAGDDLCERLSFINRTFENVLITEPYRGHFSQILKQHPDLEGKINLSTSDGPSRVGGEFGFAPLADQSLDLFVSNLLLHWVNDVPGLLAQARAALRPDGLLLVSFLGGRTLQELRSVLAQAETELGQGPRHRVSPFADAQDGAQLLQRARFALPVADSDVITVRYDTIFGLFRDLKAMGETAAFAKRPESPLTRAIIARAGDIYARNYCDDDGRIRATFEIITLTGWSPHSSQQQPLKPGSAKMRLAEALGTTEIASGEKPNGQ